MLLPSVRSLARVSSAASSQSAHRVLLLEPVGCDMALAPLVFVNPVGRSDLAESNQRYGSDLQKACSSDAETRYHTLLFVLGATHAVRHFEAYLDCSSFAGRHVAD